MVYMYAALLRTVCAAQRMLFRYKGFRRASAAFCAAQHMPITWVRVNGLFRFTGSDGCVCGTAHVEKGGLKGGQGAVAAAACDAH